MLPCCSPPGELQSEAREREETRKRQLEQLEKHGAKPPGTRAPAARAAPAAAPDAPDAPAASSKPITVHDLVSDAPVLTEAPAADGGVQGLHWSQSQLRSDDDGDQAHEFIDCTSHRAEPPASLKAEHPNQVQGQWGDPD